MKHLLLVTEEYPPQIGGVATHLSLLYESNSDWSVTIVAPLARDEGTAKAQIIRIPFTQRVPPWPRWFFLFFRLLKIVRTQKPDVVVAGQVLPIGLLLAVISRLTRVPFLVSVYGMDVLTAERVPRKKILLGWILHRATRAIANSSYTASLVAQHGVSHKQIAVITPASSYDPASLARDTERMALLRKRHHLEDKRIVFFIGRLVERKGVRHVLAALPKLLATQPDVVFCVGGKGPERNAIEKQAHEMDLLASVIFLGSIPQDEVSAWYHLAEVFVTTQLPARSNDVEGFGIVFLDAAAHGVPSVGGNNGGVVDAIVDGETGILVDPMDADAVASALIRLLEDKAYARQLGERGKDRVAQSFLWRHKQAQLYSLLEKL